MATAEPVRLKISVKATLWRMDDPRSGEADAAFASIWRQVLDLYGDRCAACGFETRVDAQRRAGAAGHFEVHHRDDDHSNNRLENLALLCPFCHAYFHLGKAGMDGRLYLASVPRLSAEAVNYLSHQVHVGREAVNPRLRELAADVQGLFDDGAGYLEKVAPELSNPVELANLLLQADAKQEEELRGEISRLAIKAVPNLDCAEYQPKIAFWNREVIGKRYQIDFEGDVRGPARRAGTP